MIQKAWQQLQPHINIPYVIHIVGTNGKGSTGRFLASLLHQSGKKVLHYSSPHIIEFNERIWIDGNNVSDQELEKTHQELIKILDKKFLEQLTYFEYTTLLALYLSNDLEYLVLEAGLGGEFDATNVVTNDLSIFTPIGYDHQNFLGKTLEAIATTKMKSCDNRFILSKQRYKEVEVIAKKVLSKKEQIVLKALALNESVNKLPLYLQENFNTALNVLEFLEIRLTTYQIPKLFGRCEKLTNNILIDVGHNPLAATVLAEELKKYNQKFILIYNSFEDKDYKEVLAILSPYIKEVQIIPCDDKRIVKKESLVNCIEDLPLNIKNFDIISINQENYYLVFGSFLVVESFLKDYKNHEKR